jgi:hypothetical protein
MGSRKEKKINFNEMKSMNILILIIIVVIVGVVLLKKTGNHSTDNKISTFSEAKILAEHQLPFKQNTTHRNIITAAEETTDGWIFFYVNEEYLKTLDFKELVPGNVHLKVLRNGNTEYLSQNPTNRSMTQLHEKCIAQGNQTLKMTARGDSEQAAAESYYKCLLDENLPVSKCFWRGKEISMTTKGYIERLEGLK